MVNSRIGGSLFKDKGYSLPHEIHFTRLTLFHKRKTPDFHHPQKKEPEQSRTGTAIHTQGWRSSGFFPTYPKNNQAHHAEELKVPYESRRHGNHQPLVHDDHPHNIPLMACFMPPPADLFHTSIQPPGKTFLQKERPSGI